MVVGGAVVGVAAAGDADVGEAAGVETEAGPDVAAVPEGLAVPDPCGAAPGAADAAPDTCADVADEEAAVAGDAPAAVALPDTADPLAGTAPCPPTAPICPSVEVIEACRWAMLDFSCAISAATVAADGACPAPAGAVPAA